MTEITATKSTRSGGVPARRRLPDSLPHWARMLAPLALMAAIFWASAQPYDGHEMAWWELAARTLGHFAGYALLAAAWIWALPGRLSMRLALATALALLYAIGDEYHQTFVEGRTGTVDDVLVDSLGIATALLLVATQARGRRERPD